MTTHARAAAPVHAVRAVRAKLNVKPPIAGTIIFGFVLLIGIIYAAMSIHSDVSPVQATTKTPYILLGVALLIALGFEFVNGFHDTANAVATVIYTNSMEPHLAVVWSGLWNFLGVLTSSGAVAYGIIALLPAELILQSGGNAGFAMVFALLIAAILWNLGTWYFGLPSSSSHTMIGSIIGVGIANQLMSPKSGTSGVDWNQALNIGRTLVLSPLFGFLLALILLSVSKALIKDKRLYQAPQGDEPPPIGIRAMLIATCTGVSFFHGSNDGQKGMGLIMLILVGTVPTAYALNHAVTDSQTIDFIAVSQQTAAVVNKYVSQTADTKDSRADLTDYIRTKEFTPYTTASLHKMILDIGAEMDTYRNLKNVPANQVRNVRNDMYIVNESMRLMGKADNPHFSPEDLVVLENYKKHIGLATRFIPIWVKVAVALALSLGTMVGWKRIVVTVGEKIGKDHLTYAQGAAAEITAMFAIGAADGLGVPVSTTHVLSSGVAGTMVANGSSLQMSTVRNLLLAWTLTLPASVVLSGTLFWSFRAMGF